MTFIHTAMLDKDITPLSHLEETVRGSLSQHTTRFQFPLFHPEQDTLRNRLIMYGTTRNKSAVYIMYKYIYIVALKKKMTSEE